LARAVIDEAATAAESLIRKGVDADRLRRAVAFVHGNAERTLRAVQD
jgi:hypothetical protein